MKSGEVTWYRCTKIKTQVTTTRYISDVQFILKSTD